MTTRDLRQLRFAAWPFAVLALALALPNARTAAQALCDEDAGALACDDDAGVSLPAADAGPDAGGPTVPSAGTSGGRADAGIRRDAGTTATACSCEATLEEDGRIHVCTESGAANVCSSFDCEIGTRRNFPCPQRPTRLCCEMPARSLQSYLYEDCDHPNCESGFRQQCHSFGGLVYAGACENPATGRDHGPHDDDSDGVCAVSAPGRRSTAPVIGLVLALAAAALGARRRRDR